MDLNQRQRDLLRSLDAAAKDMLGEPDPATLERLDALIADMLRKKGTDGAIEICLFVQGLLLDSSEDPRNFPLASEDRNFARCAVERNGGLTMANFLLEALAGLGETEYLRVVAAINGKALEAYLDRRDFDRL